MNKYDLLDRIQSTQLDALKLNMHLDVFPNDKKSKDEFEKLSYELDCLLSEYQNSFGPLSNFGLSYIENPVLWTSDPWPWDNEQ